jgi:hypothetical protein
MKIWFKRVLLSLLAIFVVIQLVPVDRADPPLDPAKKLQPPPEVEAILRVSCYDCHSNETRWPWYSYVAPVSWWMANHVHDGRRRLNLSDWTDLKPGPEDVQLNGLPYTTVEYKRKMLSDMETDIEEGRMPISSYLIIHHDARMSPEQYRVVADWLEADMGKQK